MTIVDNLYIASGEGRDTGVVFSLRTTLKKQEQFGSFKADQRYNSKTNSGTGNIPRMGSWNGPDGF